MTPGEFAELRADIAEYGVRQPIIVDRVGRVLDGRHRARAAGELGIACPRTVFSGTEDEAAALVLSANLHRRSLTAAQKGATIQSVGAIVDAARAAAKARQVEGARQRVAPVPQQTLGVRHVAHTSGSVTPRDTPPVPSTPRQPLRAADELAAKAGVSSRTMQRVAKATADAVTAEIVETPQQALDQIKSGQATAGALQRKADEKLERTHAAIGLMRRQDAYRSLARQLRKVLIDHRHPNRFQFLEFDAPRLDAKRRADFHDVATEVRTLLDQAEALLSDGTLRRVK